MLLGSRQTLPLVLLGLFVFALVVAVILRFMPAPHRDSDYLVAGSCGTLASLGVMFLVVMMGIRAGRATLPPKKDEQ